MNWTVRSTRPLRRRSAAAANVEQETVMQYNARKESAIPEIYERAFMRAGILPS